MSRSWSILVSADVEARLRKLILANDALRPCVFLQPRCEIYDRPGVVEFHMVSKIQFPCVASRQSEANLKLLHLFRIGINFNVLKFVKPALELIVNVQNHLKD